MRKVFFSFVATLAFGSFAMANTIELQQPVVEIETVESHNLQLTDFIEDVSCFDEAYDDYEYALFYYLDNEDDIELLNLLVDTYCYNN